jgi:hypothetical protein
MFISSTITSYTAQNSISSIESNESEISTLSLCNTMQYGPITVRLCRKAAPRLATGRRSKYLVLVGEEATRREKRREKNRAAAKRLKEKRQLIEDELNQKLKGLENQYSGLQNYLQQLQQKKQNLENEVNKFIKNPLNELLLNDHHDTPSFFGQYSNDLDLFDESIERILNMELDNNFYSMTYN